MMLEFLNNLAFGLGWIFILVFVGVWAAGSVIVVMHVIEERSNKRPEIDT